MLITQTPLRISFFGGGTDYEAHFLNHGGSVISTSINKYSYVTMRHMPPHFPYSSQLTYSKIERFNHCDEVQHPLVREILRHYGVERIQIAYDSDLPARSGLGSSSSFAVGLINAVHTLNGERVSKRRLADEAIYAERVLCAEAGGIQDQIAVAFGGLNRIDFGKDSYNVRPLSVTEETRAELEKNLMLLFSGSQRYSYDIAQTQQKNIAENRKYLSEMSELTNEAERLLQLGDTDAFGRLLNRTWELKRRLSDQISTPVIDEIYSRALDAGALGGKLLGAGGGGFILLYVRPENRAALSSALGNLLEIPFRFETGGAKLLYNGVEEL